jgi:hypothetical protein
MRSNRFSPIFALSDQAEEEPWGLKLLRMVLTMRYNKMQEYNTWKYRDEMIKFGLMYWGFDLSPPFTASFFS